MDRMDGRSLVAAYLKQLRISRGVEQAAVAERLGIHKNTVFRAELVAGHDASAKLETAIAIARALGGDVGHVVALRAGRLPADYPAGRMDTSALTPEVAADVARWHVQMQDSDLYEQTARAGLPPMGLRDVMESLKWEAFQDPRRILRVYL